VTYGKPHLGNDGSDPNANRTPVIFDILAPDLQTSILPEDFRLVLHVNPASMSIQYSKDITRIPTRGGFVEQHWGDGARNVEFAMATGGFMRLYSGLSNITGGDGAYDAGGTRRETLAYDRYLDMLALFHNNGSVYDATGKIVFQGIISILFDGHNYFGWFGPGFSVDESVDRPYQFALSTTFIIDHEIQTFNSPAAIPVATDTPNATGGGR
jgi:hypothetical protein